LLIDYAVNFKLHALYIKKKSDDKIKANEVGNLEAKHTST